MSVKLLTEHRLEFLSLKWGCTGSSESILVKMTHCWKSHGAAQMSVTSKCHNHRAQTIPMHSKGLNTGQGTETRHPHDSMNQKGKSPQQDDC